MLAAVKKFFHMEASGGIVLVFAAAIALLWANSPYADLYVQILDVPVGVRAGEAGLEKPLLLWINDGLMAIFFLLVGLEIKREVMHGSLSSLDKAALPGIAALGGMVFPALIYVAFTFSDPTALNGWAIPAATDIAFALGVLALAGPRVPASLKVFLLALAVMDDLGAIIIIALFYTSDLSVLSLSLGGAAVLMMLILNRLGVSRIGPYAFLGIFLWVCVLKSGVHATLAGVVMAFAIPMHAKNHNKESPAERLEHALHPWCNFAILPFFAFANAGVSLEGMDLAALANPVTLGVAAGLFVGKQIGVVGITYAATRVGLAKLPVGTTWMQFYGVSLLTGIGFTMSLFIGTLAFTEHGYDAPVRLGVLGGSFLSAVVGFIVLRMSVIGKKPQFEAAA